MANMTIHQTHARTLIRAGALSVLAVLCASALSGCAAPTENSLIGYPVFDREQTEEDQLPSSFDQLDLVGYDLTTVRFSGSHNDVNYYLLRTYNADPGTGYCLAIGSGENPIIGCAGVGGGSVGGDGLATAEFMPGPAITIDDWFSVSDNVRVWEKS
jgi:hypothetical protein